MEKLFGLILDTVFALKNLVISHTHYFVVEEILL